jgi:hypothetical protein
MHLSAKPVRKCHGCGLNLGDRCGVFENPRLMWERHAACPGYRNEKMLAEYQVAEARRQAHLKKEKRRLLAKMQHAVPHHNGDQHVIIAAVRR